MMSPKKHRQPTSNSSRSPPQHHHHRSKAKPRPKPTSVNQLNKRIRDATRLLQRSTTLGADVRMEIERAKDAYEQDLAATKAEKRRQKMIGRYHKVRFFERQKATRRLNQLRKRLASAAAEGEVKEERTRLKVMVHEAEVDLSYTLYYPLDQKYVALYADRKGGGPIKETEDEEDDGSVERVKPPLWKEVERRMETGGLEELKNGGALVARRASTSEKKIGRVKRTTRSMEDRDRDGDDGRKKRDKRARHREDEEEGDENVDKDEDEESDGGFFE